MGNVQSVIGQAQHALLGLVTPLPRRISSIGVKSRCRGVSRFSRKVTDEVDDNLFFLFPFSHEQARGEIWGMMPSRFLWRGFCRGFLV